MPKRKSICRSALWDRSRIYCWQPWLASLVRSSKCKPAKRRSADNWDERDQPNGFCDGRESEL